MSNVSPVDARVAVIGAGIAGLACAQHLKAKGYRTTVFEKSRGLGGRLSTRRLEDGVTFDHGAQYLTARSGAFLEFLQRAMQAKFVEHWRPQVPSGSDLVPDQWFVGAPTMNALTKPLADGIDVRFQVQVTSIEREGGSWCVRTRSRDQEQLFDAVACCVPAPQAHNLLCQESPVERALARVSFAPCWALMLAFSGPMEPGFDVRRSQSDTLSWIARNSSKPRRKSEKDCWVIHAGPDWSSHHLGVARDEVAQKLIKMLPAAFGRKLPDVEHAAAHCWRYALTTAPLGMSYICSQDQTLFVGGDWCLGARVESAFASGHAIANALSRALKS